MITIGIDTHKATLAVSAIDETGRGIAADQVGDADRRFGAHSLNRASS